MQTYSTQTPGNNYRINCPVTGRDDQLLVLCGSRIARNLRGESINERDCVCAMSAGKCPGKAIQQIERNKGRVLFVDKVMKSGRRLPRVVLELIERKIILNYHREGARLDEATFKGMWCRGEAPSEHGDEHVDTADCHDIDAGVASRPIKSAAVRPSAAKTSTRGDVMVSDMTDLLNQAIQTVD